MYLHCKSSLWGQRNHLAWWSTISSGCSCWASPASPMHPPRTSCTQDTLPGHTSPWSPPSSRSDPGDEQRCKQCGTSRSERDLWGMPDSFRTVYDWHEQELNSKPGIFSSLIGEFGSKFQTGDAQGDSEGGCLPAEKDAEVQVSTAQNKGHKLFLDEEQNSGMVSSQVYYSYLKAINSWSLIILFSSFLIMAQVSTVGNSLFLGYWSGDVIPDFSQSQYMALYAGKPVTKQHAVCWLFRFWWCNGYFLGDIVVISVEISCSHEQFAASYSMITAGLKASFALLMVLGTRLCIVQPNGMIEHL